VSSIANRAGPRASKAMGPLAWGIGLSLQVRRPTKQLLVPRWGSRGSIPSSAPGKSQVGGRCQLALLLARGGRKRQGSRRGAVSYTRVAFSGYDNTAPIRWEEVPVKRHPYRIATEDEPTADRFGQIFAPNIVFRSPVAADPVQGVEVVEPSGSLPIR
jgi:hypothetical protein